jgi:nicotinamide-nucleotide amidase
LKKAYIISTGTELLIGSTIDTNSVFLSEKLMALGIRVVGKSTVGDNAESIKNAFNTGLATADIVISSGGLGPTFDDLTKTVACEVMGTKLELRPEEAERIKMYFERRQRKMPDINLKQAMFPPEAKVLPNPLGTAPGMYLKKGDKVVVLLPGPPREMQPMYLNELEPLLSSDFKLVRKALTRTIKVLGPGESQVEELIEDVMKNPEGCSLALIAKDGEVHIRVTAEGKDLKHSGAMLDSVTHRIKERLGNNVFGYDDDTLPSIAGILLKAHNKSLAVAESCTGGLLGRLITDIPGSSSYFWGGIISYSNEAKIELLKVDSSILEKFGAVSSTIAEAMAKGVVKQSGADIGVAITGIAGPEGGTDLKPVGLVYIGLAEGDYCESKELRFVGERNAIRLLAAKSALDMVRRHLQQTERE